MHKVFKVTYNAIFYLSLFLAFVGLYCHITYNYISDSNVLYLFIGVIVLSFFTVRLLRYLFLRLSLIIKKYLMLMKLYFTR